MAIRIILLTLLCLLGLLLALLLLLLFLPLRLRVSYDRGTVSVRGGIAPVMLRLYPRTEKPESEKTTAEEKRKAGSRGKKAKADVRTKGKQRSINADQVLYTLEELPPVLGRALKRIGRGIRIEPLHIYLLVAGADPADTAVLYGRILAGAASLCGVLRDSRAVKDMDLQVFVDFQEEKMDCIADVGIAFRLCTLVFAALCAGASVLNWYRGFQRLAVLPATKACQQEEPEKEETIA